MNSYYSGKILKCLEEESIKKFQEKSDQFIF